MVHRHFHALRAPLLSLITPTLLRTLRLTPNPLSPTLLLLLAALLLVIEKGYSDTLETLSPELSEHTGPFWHLGVCLLAYGFCCCCGGLLQGWRAEVLFWTLFARWGMGMSRCHRAGVKVFRNAYVALVTPSGARLQGAVTATVLALGLLVGAGEGVPWLLVAAVWLHFYHCVGYALAAWTYFSLSEKERNFVEERRRWEST